MKTLTRLEEIEEELNELSSYGLTESVDGLNDEIVNDLRVLEQEKELLKGE